MKKFTMLLIVAFLLVGVLGACNAVPTETDASTTLPKPSNSDATASTEPNTPSDTEINATDPSKTQPIIPTDPEELAGILKGIGLKDVKMSNSDDFLGYAYMGNLDCVVEGILPGPEEEAIFFYCADTDTAVSINSYFSIEINSTGENYYAVKKENNIVFFGPAEVWEDFVTQTQK